MHLSSSCWYPAVSSCCGTGEGRLCLGRLASAILGSQFCCWDLVFLRLSFLSACRGWQAQSCLGGRGFSLVLAAAVTQQPHSSELRLDTPRSAAGVTAANISPVTGSNTTQDYKLLNVIHNQCPFPNVSYTDMKSVCRARQIFKINVENPSYFSRRR